VRIDLCLNVRFSSKFIRSQMCDPANEKCIEWSDMNEAEMRSQRIELGFCPGPAHFSRTRPGSFEVG
jgi:hypothetical protein